jgi:hypothetical protein
MNSTLSGHRQSRGACTLVWLVLGLALAVSVRATDEPSGRVEILRPSSALPPHVTGLFREPAGFVALKDGSYLVFDRRAHAVYRVDREREHASQLVAVGHESGRLIQPAAFAAGADGTFVVADAPFGRQRVQLFSEDGKQIGGWTLPGEVAELVRLGGLVLNGVGSLQYDGNHIFVNEPERGALITRYTIDGRPDLTIGRLRDTPYAGTDDALHRAFNTGLPLVDPRGGYYFVFQTGEPRFRKYDAKGALVFERVIQGRELDRLRASQATAWPSRAAGSREMPAVPPVVRTAGVAPDGELWVTLAVPFTYVFDEDGEKVRVVRFEAAGSLSPESLSFTADGHVLVAPGCYVFDAGR